MVEKQFEGFLSNFNTEKVLESTKIFLVKTRAQVLFELENSRRIVARNNKVININEDALRKTS